jgi:hypothetical protein
MSQLFKKNVSINLLFDFLNKINCQKNEKYFIVDVTAYKRSMYINLLHPFLNELKEYYYASKYKYVDIDKMNHNKFNTIIRQICKNTNTNFFKTLRHDQSKYSVVYNIDFSKSNNISASVNANDNTNDVNDTNKDPQ